jgi:type II secretory pathway pseudopilin PulG
MNHHHKGTPSSGMTLIQLLILIVLVVIIGALTLPPWLENRKVSQADVDVDTLATGIQKYFKHTGKYPEKLEDLGTDPGIEGWRGKYIEEIPEIPWGGRYQILPDSYKVCIPSDHPRVPAKYKLGGVAEISRVYLEGKEGAKYWW